MIEVSFSIRYRAEEGQYLCVSGSVPELGAWQNAQAPAMHREGEDLWTLNLRLPKYTELVEYGYLVKDAQGRVLRREWKPLHSIQLSLFSCGLKLIDHWIQDPEQKVFFNAAYYDVLTARPIKDTLHTEELAGKLLLYACAPALTPSKQIYVLGSSPSLGSWQTKLAIPMDYIGKGQWRATIPLTEEEWGQDIEYKHFIANEYKQGLQWEKADNHRISLGAKGQVCVASSGIIIEDASYRPRFAGAVCPLFSLRHDADAGIGDFTALRQAVDWAKQAKIHILQLLPINDTTFYRDWRDSYPYNAISTDALHPIYISLVELEPLSDTQAQTQVEECVKALRLEEQVNYPKVIELKEEYLRLHYAEYGAKVKQSEAYKSFYDANSSWLEPYAAYCVLRDEYPNKVFNLWQGCSTYDDAYLHLAKNKTYGAKADYHCYVQFLLHQQLSAVAEYAEEQGVLLKGDLPIGVAPHSVEVWRHPELFHTDRSAGAPPDDFALRGQNWGFPTYNWERMFDDRLAWWHSRFARLSQYFKALRIDHILGFFRIWEIPREQTSGLLGHFSPAMPLPIEFWQEEFPELGDLSLYTKPLIAYEEGEQAFAGLLPELIEQGIWQVVEANGRYLRLVDGRQSYWREYPSEAIAGGDATLSLLHDYCEETLLIQDSTDPQLYHPRIAWSKSKLFATWAKETQYKWFGLDYWYYYERHNEQWKQTALKRLRPFVACTEMLICAEDLGMIPSTVPEVLDELQVLSLELERMPKVAMLDCFTKLKETPYLSVCTTSTHDMPPLRAWYQNFSEEEHAFYLEKVLTTKRPTDLQQPEGVYRHIVRNHLASPSMLVILPLQDWMSIDKRLHLQAAEAEQINHPENPNQHWNYRFPVTMTELQSTYASWTERIAQMLEVLDRE